MSLLPADIGRSIADIRTALALDDLDALVAETIDTVSLREREVRDRAGHWYSLRVRPYRTLENRIDGAVLVLVDIDDLKRTQYALMESERRFELLADSAPVLIWVSDTEGMRFVNRAFESFVGASEHEIQVAEPARYVHRDERAAYAQAYRNAFERKETFEMRFRMRRADGAYRWMKTVATPSFLASGEMLGLVGCTFDVTDMKEAESALVEFDEGKDRFLAMLAHELRNPLAAIRSASQLLSRSKDPLDHAVGREIIGRQTEHMARMVEDLLDVARITHGKIVLRTRPLDLVALLREAVASTQAARAAHRQRLTPSLPADALWVVGDAMRMQQIFVNLLDNATKFTRDGGHLWLTVEREKVDSGADMATRFAAVRVRDDGMGISHALLPRVFELFTQGEEGSSERSRAGIGVGLSLAKSLVELHGGTITAFSAGESLGSEFVLRFPLLDPERSSADRASGANARSGTATPKRRILLVDDNHDVGDALRGLLAALGHEVVVTRDGADALARVRDVRPEIVLLDINLPDMDGYELARRMRAMDATRSALIFALTGFGQPDDLRRSLEAGIDRHLTKPIDVDKLEACFEGALAGRSRGDGDSHP
jgi:two-component system CheB/CheR fusion protein